MALGCCLGVIVFVPLLFVDSFLVVWVVVPAADSLCVFTGKAGLGITWIPASHGWLSQELIFCICDEPWKLFSLS